MHEGPLVSNDFHHARNTFLIWKPFLSNFTEENSITVDIKNWHLLGRAWASPTLAWLHCESCVCSYVCLFRVFSRDVVLGGNWFCRERKCEEYKENKQTKFVIVWGGNSKLGGGGNFQRWLRLLQAWIKQYCIIYASGKAIPNWFMSTVTLFLRGIYYMMTSPSEMQCVYIYRSLVPRPPPSSVCIQYNTRKQKSAKGTKNGGGLGTRLYTYRVYVVLLR